MPRPRRHVPGSLIYHAINRGVGRRTIFHKQEDYAALERVLAEVHHEIPIRTLGYRLMPSHWHFVLWPREDGELSTFMRRLTHTPTQRWHAHYHTSGTGHLYQGRFKKFPVKQDMHLFLVLRYAERNALRANLVAQAQDWTWSSLWRRENRRGLGLLTEWPVERPADWAVCVNEPQDAAELAAIRRSVTRGWPFGDEAWCEQTVRELGLQPTMRDAGRPRKGAARENP